MDLFAGFADVGPTIWLTQSVERIALPWHSAIILKNQSSSQAETVDPDRSIAKPAIARLGSVNSNELRSTRWTDAGDDVSASTG
jgi:hypothetical protein